LTSRSKTPSKALRSILRLVELRSGLMFNERNQARAEQGVRRLMARVNETSITLFFRRLVFEDALVDALIDELTVWESYFFREPRQFDLIAEELMPRLCEHQKVPVLRIWSAGCATGEEPYSLAILFARSRCAAKTRILGTDISHRALEIARAGRYRAWSMRGEARQRAGRFLHEVDGAVEVTPTIRESVTFRHLNLASTSFPQGDTERQDLILCRNVLIYLTPSVTQVVVKRLFDALRPGGWLLTASTDPPLEGWAPFVRQRFGSMWCYHRPDERLQTKVLVPMIDQLERGQSRAQSWVESGQQLVDAGRQLLARNQRRVLQGVIKTDTIKRAHDAFSKGAYQDAATLTEHLSGSDAACLNVRALAQHDPARALKRASQAADTFPDVAELRYLEGLLHMEHGALEDAEVALKKALLLAPKMSAAHLLRGMVLRRLGYADRAQEAFERARDLLAPEDTQAVVSDALAGELLDEARFQLHGLDTTSDHEPRDT